MGCVSVIDFCSCLNNEGDRIEVRATNCNRIGSVKNSLSANQKRMVEMREALKCNKDIARDLALNQTYVNQFLKGYYGNNDPLHLHVVESFRSGESAKAISRRLNIHLATITHILKSRGIKPWEEYLNRASAHYRSFGISKNCHKKKRDYKSLSRDLYCFYRDGLKIEKISLLTGYSAPYISRLFNDYIPEYRKRSLKRHTKSKDNSLLQKRGYLSRKFPKEQEFQRYCEKLLQDFNITSRCNNKSDIEVDLIVHGKILDVLIELKVRTRKADACKAIGQTVLCRQTYQGRSESIICVPDDVDYYPGFERAARSIGIYLVKAYQLRTKVGELIAI